MSDNLWIVGVALVIIGSLGNNFGTNLVSYDHKLKEEENEKRERSKTLPSSPSSDIESAGDASTTNLLKQDVSSSPSQNQVALDNNNDCNKDTVAAEIQSNETKKKEGICNLRVIGVTTFVVGNLATFAAFGFAAQSLLAALESIQFVSNIIFAKYIHKEIITWRMIMATTSIILGNILVVIFSVHETALYTSLDIGYLYATNVGYWIYVGIAALLWLFFHLTFLKYYNARVNDKKLLDHHAFVEPFAFSVSSSIIGTQAVLQAKCMSMLIQVSLRGERNEFALPWVYIILVAWLFFVVFWLRRLDLGLALFPPLFIIPVLQVFFVFFAIVCGGIFFEEFTTFGASQWVGFIFGVTLILGGVYGLAPTDTKAVVVLPNDMAHEVADEVKESIKEIVPETVIHGIQSARQAIFTPRIDTSSPIRTNNGNKYNTAASPRKNTNASLNATPRNNLLTPRNNNSTMSPTNMTTPRSNRINTGNSSSSRGELVSFSALATAPPNKFEFTTDVPQKANKVTVADRYIPVDDSDMKEQLEDEYKASSRSRSTSINHNSVSNKGIAGSKGAKSVKDVKTDLLDQQTVSSPKLKPTASKSSDVPSVAPFKVVADTSPTIKNDEL